MTRLRLNLACHISDRTRALHDGSVPVEGADVNWIPLHVAEIFWRMCQHQEFDVSEMSLGAHAALIGKGDSPFVAVPVFPSRMFRHSGIYISAKRGVERPEDLRGRRIGVPEYAQTACVWMRGLLHHEYGIAAEEVTWVFGGLEVPGRKERVALELPSSIRLERLSEGDTLNQALCEGKIDAVMSADAPSSFVAGDPRIRRLFPDFRSVERDYFQRTRIFPIMHTLVIRRDVWAHNPWLAQSLLKAFTRAKHIVERELTGYCGWLICMLPWSTAELQDTKDLMGDDFWPYGLDPNRKVLETFCLYAKEQGITSRRVLPEELFAPSTLESWKL
ncbi:MAG: ABC transporter substrate-binding protein [Candidatus Acidiferrales bacterium]